MNKLVILVVLGLIAGTIYFGIKQFEKFGSEDLDTSDVSQENFLESNGIRWFQPESRDFNLAVFTSPFELRYTPEHAQSIEEQAYIGDYELAVNGGYFRGSALDAEHAGLLQVDGELVFGPVQDVQLTHAVVYDQSADLISFVPAETIDPVNYAPDRFTLFQSGPLLIKDNQIQAGLINSSINGSQRTLRTVLGYTDSGDKFVLVTRRNYTLTELAEQIMSFKIFEGKLINVINLDGGTSTAMYSRGLEQFNFMKSRRLPIVIGVK